MFYAICYVKFILCFYHTIRCNFIVSTLYTVYRNAAVSTHQNTGLYRNPSKSNSNFSLFFSCICCTPFATCIVSTVSLSYNENWFHCLPAWHTIQQIAAVSTYRSTVAFGNPSKSNITFSRFFPCLLSIVTDVSKF